MENKKLTQEELNQIIEIQDKYRVAVEELGNIELQKLALEKRRQTAEQFLSNLQQEDRELSQAIEEKYGKGNLNLSTGEFTSLEGELVEE